MKEEPAYENFDTNMENEKELEEAKEKAGVKNKDKMLDDSLEHAYETGDEKLFDEVSKIQKEKESESKLFSQETIESDLKSMINKEFLKESEEQRKIRLNRAIYLYSKNKEENKDYLLEEAVEEVKVEAAQENIKKINKDYVVNKGGIVDILEKNSEEKAS